MKKALLALLVITVSLISSAYSNQRKLSVAATCDSLDVQAVLVVEADVVTGAFDSGYISLTNKGMITLLGVHASVNEGGIKITHQKDSKITNGISTLVLEDQKYTLNCKVL